MLSNQALELWPLNARKTADAEYRTHLTVNFFLKVKIDQDKN
jgi:hypothetical protein